MLMNKKIISILLSLSLILISKNETISNNNFDIINPDFIPVPKIKSEKQLKPTIKKEQNPDYIKQEIWLKESNGTHLKYYEDYRMITDPSSNQYKFQQRKDVKEDYRGFLMQNNEWYAVALGGYFGDIGTKYIFTMSTERQIKVVKGDEKAAADTCEDCYLSYNGHILEFMINSDHEWMHENQITTLNFTQYEPFQGHVVKIEKIIDNIN